MDKIFVKDNRLYKVFTDEAVFEQTLENSIEAQKIAMKSRVFRAPRVLNSSTKRREICFEYLADYLQVISILRSFNFKGLDMKKLRKMFFDIGVGLAEYHIGSKKIHGDFDPTNVMYSNSMDIVYIDFSQPKHCPYEKYNRGSIYRDLALMYIYINTKYPLHKIYYAFRRANKKLSLAFVRGYFHARADVQYEETEFKKEYDEYLERTYLSKNIVTLLFRPTRLFSYAELSDV